jgi:hypothetical protein
MTPIDTIKTRLVTQAGKSGSDLVPTEALWTVSFELPEKIACVAGVSAFVSGHNDG